jgi:hypothetical protein
MQYQFPSTCATEHRPQPCQHIRARSQFLEEFESASYRSATPSSKGRDPRYNLYGITRIPPGKVDGDLARSVVIQRLDATLTFVAVSIWELASEALSSACSYRSFNGALISTRGRSTVELIRRRPPTTGLHSQLGPKLSFGHCANPPTGTCRRATATFTRGSDAKRFDPGGSRG